METFGTLYGVGVGPGDPELLTQKALRVLHSCSVWAVPQTRSGETLALDIAKQAIDVSQKTVVPLYFTMERDVQKQQAAHMQAAAQIESYLTSGQDVAMLNLGDISIYATFGYLQELLSQKGFPIEMIPGVPSFCAVAARLGTSLTTMNSPLHILPAGKASLQQSLRLPGTKIFMKAGKRLPEIVAVLQQEGLCEKAALVQNCGLPGEHVWTDLSTLPQEAGYFATLIVKE